MLPSMSGNLTGSLSRLSATPEAAVGPSGSTRKPECPGLTIRHLLLPLDGSALAECALPWAVAVAQVFAARITLLRILEPPAGAVPMPHAHDVVEWQIRRAEAHSHLARLESAVRASGLTSSLELLEGRPAEQILNFARDHAADLVVLSSHGEGGLSGWVLSSTAQKVVARVDSSVLVIPAHTAGTRPAGELRLRRIFVPLDCSPRAECVIPLAVALARAHDAELILAHVVPEPEMPRRLPPSAEDAAIASRLTEHNRVEGERYLGELRSQLADRTLRVTARSVVSSRRAPALRALADEADVDLIVACAHGRSADASERYGSVAARLLAESSRPILVVQDFGRAGWEPTRAEEAARSRPGH
jgi:nucleotide-binding universal stress UspA family protein